MTTIRETLNVRPYQKAWLEMMATMPRGTHARLRMFPGRNGTGFMAVDAKGRATHFWRNGKWEAR